MDTSHIRPESCACFAVCRVRGMGLMDEHVAVISDEASRRLCVHLLLQTVWIRLNRDCSARLS